MRRLVIAALLFGACTPETTTPGLTQSPTVAPAVSASPSATASTAAGSYSPLVVPTCFSPAPPTYLPWGSVPQPDAITNEKGVTYVRYQGSADATGQRTYFSVTRAPRSMLDAVPDVPPQKVAGRDVAIYRVGDPGVGEVAARWDEGMDGCVYQAHLWLPRAGAADEAELAKIIASLDVWGAVRAQLPSTIAVLRPSFVPARFADRPVLLSVSLDPFPHYWVAYAAGPEQLHFYLGAANSGPPTSRMAVGIRGNAGTISTSASWPAIQAEWGENGQNYIVQGTSSVTQAEMRQMLTGLVEVR